MLGGGKLFFYKESKSTQFFFNFFFFFFFGGGEGVGMEGVVWRGGCVARVSEFYLQIIQIWKKNK